METIPLTFQQRHLIEELAVFLEKGHVTPAAARILALLVVSDEPELTFDQIRDALEFSKSATSTALNGLLLNESVKYSTRPHDRKRYFHSCFIHWNDRVKDVFRELTEVIGVMKRILEQRPASTPEFNESLRNVIRFVEFVAAEMPALYRKWEKINTQSNR
ncbi:MAG TPA: helix-turn-helix domain-containing protein [Bacteroidales bacterium]|nr:helix-turn-helix domain-containing protein [Bacteroidales bacterium]